ncbi:relaxase domain-containing protein [Qipengyuania flava]|uniref:relaxase domain-containing protein n=1 Tax=Qipengyuania flava TaxID=192812 RepID=UPI001F1BCD5D|nr:relaxase domain-containing protein [Qipengyuania flava]
MAPSEWIGEAAEKLGLSGEVDREKFADLLEGRISGTSAISNSESFPASILYPSAVILCTSSCR